MTIAPHVEWFTVYTFQEDEGARATVQTLAGYMQEAAGNHAAAMGLSIDRLHGAGVAWVLARMRILPVSFPGVHERMQVETWPVSVDGLHFRRDFIVRDGKGGVLARAVSHWVVVSLASHRVTRIPEFIAEVALNSAATAMEDTKRRIPEVGEGHEACVFRARLADIDRNRHVNNVRYMEWIVESVPEATRQTGELADLELAFKAESVHNDVVSARTLLMPEDDEGLPEGVRGFYHSLVRANDGKELVRARSVWRARCSNPG